MPRITLLQMFGIFVPVFPSFASAFSFDGCACAVNSTFGDVSSPSFLIASDGNPTNDTNTAWGITYSECMIHCGGGWEAFDWTSESDSFSDWVLPWLALTAQLPYENKVSSTNLLSLFMAIGSPMLITYSLCLTILKSRWINKRFCVLRDRNEEVLGKQVRTLEAARVFLRESQHVPIGISDSWSTIAQLIVLPVNRKSWWRSIHKAVIDSKRPWYVHTSPGKTNIGSALSVYDLIPVPR